MMDEIIEGYCCQGEWKTAANGDYIFAHKDGREFFLKRFQEPKYPEEGLSADFRDKKIKRCEQFSQERRKIIVALQQVSQGNGNILTPQEFFLNKPYYYQASLKSTQQEATISQIVKLPEEKRMLLIKTLCMDLMKIHSVKIVHGDLKPENILISRSQNGELICKLIDFDDSYFSQKPPLPADTMGVDEDFKRYYPYDELASKVLGFTGGDNQGIIGLEVKYEEYLKGINGMILTTTDARGIELEGIAEDRKEAIPGNTLQISLDYNIQKYAQQAAEKVMEEKAADRVSVLVMNPQNGEILSMVNVPEFNLNDPFSLETTGVSDESVKAEEKQDLLNQMWRNGCINDTYEPGSTFKIITSSACLEEGVVKLDDTFHCPGYRIVEDRKIRCHKVGGHGSETFVQGVQNSCNPVFIDIGLRLGQSLFQRLRPVS